MKKTLSVLLTAAMLASLAVCPAYARAGVNQVPFSSVLIGQELYREPNGSPRTVETFQFSVPCDGEYHDLWYGELENGDVVSFQGAWSPSYARLTIEIMEEDGDYGTMTTITSGGSGSLRIRQSGMYTIHLKAVDRDISGTMNVDL